MLKKRLGIEAIERDWFFDHTFDYFKIPPTLIILEGCVRIGECAFDGCSKLKKVVIPKSVESIKWRAFCDSGAKIILKNRKFNKGIRAASFYGCESVEYVKEETRN